jgi:hypothetical protein
LNRTHHNVHLRKCAPIHPVPKRKKAEQGYFTVEHNTTDPSAATQAPRRRRPDLSTFFATLSEITPGPEHRPHAVPVPGDVSAAFYSLAEAFEVMRREAADLQERHGDQGEGAEDLLTRMIQTLLSDADTPPREVEGVSEEFCDSRNPH